MIAGAEQRVGWLTFVVTTTRLSSTYTVATQNINMKGIMFTVNFSAFSKSVDWHSKV